MLVPQFEYHQPASLAEAFEVLDHYGEKAKLLAGGTDLLINLKKRLLTPEHVVGLERVAGLEDIQTSRTGVSLGGRVRVAALAQSRALKRRAGVLAHGAAVLGSPLVRNRATLAGNLVTARPAADLAPPLLVLGARVVLAGSRGEREVALEEFFLGPGQSVIRPEEVLTRVLIDQPEPGTGGGYVKLGTRRTLEIAKVNVAALITLDGRGRKIKAARVALGAVAPTPILSPRAAEVLLGATAGEKAFARAGAAAAGEARPITDHRGTAEYRRWMVEVLTRRALEQALARARAKRGG